MNKNNLKYVKILNTNVKSWTYQKKYFCYLEKGKKFCYPIKKTSNGDYIKTNILWKKEKFREVYIKNFPKTFNMDKTDIEKKLYTR
jgi:hypothetical protein